MNIKPHLKKAPSVAKSVIHIASVKSAAANSGVLQQMEWEQFAALDSSLPWTAELWSADHMAQQNVHRTFPRLFQSFLGRRFYFFLRVIKYSRTHDTLIIRYSPLDLFSLFIPKSTRKKILYVFHTPTDFYLKSRAKRIGIIFAHLDRLLMRKMVKDCAGVVGATIQIIKHEQTRLNVNFKRNIIYPNGIYLDNWNKPIIDERYGPIKIIFVASRFFEWNGLEAILASIKSAKTDVPWELHLVGNLLPSQVKFIKQNDLTKCIKLHGVLASRDIAILMSAIDLSLGAFRLDKVGLHSACTLKVRESLGRGVPVYSGHSDVALSGRTSCYIEGPPDWLKILDVAQGFREKPKSCIRDAAREYIDKSILVLGLANALAHPVEECD